MPRILIGIRDSDNCIKFNKTDGAIIRRTTYGCEIDVFDYSIFHSVLKEIREESIVFSSSDEQLDRIKRDMVDKSLIIYAFTLFNQERYWEYHELLEKIWRKYNGKIKEFIQCLIHVGVSQVKFQLEQPKTANTVYLRTMEKMRSLVQNDEFQLFPEKFAYPIKFDEKQLRVILESEIMKNII